MKNLTLNRSTGLLVIDVQEKLFDKVERSCEVLCKICQIIKGFQILDLPIFVSEQYPQGLGTTIAPIQNILGPEQKYYSKTTFSCFKNDAIKEQIINLDNFVLVGIEAHVCVLQTAKDLLNLNKNVVVLNDAISSRSIYDFSSSIAELRDMGARISTTETILFELVSDAKDPAFKEISKLIQCRCETEFSPCCS